LLPPFPIILFPFKPLPYPTVVAVVAVVAVKITERKTNAPYKNNRDAKFCVSTDIAKWYEDV
jgi:hypothetical protein